MRYRGQDGREMECIVAVVRELAGWQGHKHKEAPPDWVVYDRPDRRLGRLARMQVPIHWRRIGDGDPRDLAAGALRFLPVSPDWSKCPDPEGAARAYKALLVYCDGQLEDKQDVTQLVGRFFFDIDMMSMGLDLDLNQVQMQAVKAKLRLMDTTPDAWEGHVEAALEEAKRLLQQAGMSDPTGKEGEDE